MIFVWETLGENSIKKYRKMVEENKIIEISEELNIDDFESNSVNNVIPNSKEFYDSCIRNTHFTRSKYVRVEQITNFSFRLIPKKNQILWGN